MNSAARYLTGEEIRVNDTVLLCSKTRGKVLQLLVAGTDQADYHNCGSTGGVLIGVESGDTQLWTNIDDDLQLLSREVN